MSVVVDNGNWELQNKRQKLYRLNQLCLLLLLLRKRSMCLGLVISKEISGCEHARNKTQMHTLDKRTPLNTQCTRIYELCIECGPGWRKTLRECPIFSHKSAAPCGNMPRSRKLVYDVFISRWVQVYTNTSGTSNVITSGFWLTASNNGSLFIRVREV